MTASSVSAEPLKPPESRPVFLRFAIRGLIPHDRPDILDNPRRPHIVPVALAVLLQVEADAGIVTRLELPPITGAAQFSDS